VIREPLTPNDRGYAEPGLIAAGMGVSVALVRQWARRGEAKRRYTANGRVLYRYADVLRHAQKVGHVDSEPTPVTMVA